jgi:nucleoside-diphosphate-sugar epimerase
MQQTTPLRNILIDGGTGFLGKEFIQTLAQEKDLHIYAIVREKAGVPFDKRTDLASIQLPHVTLIPGEVTKAAENGSLPIITAATHLPSIIHEYWHIAANTDFTESHRKESEFLNIGGSQNATVLATILGVEKYFHIGTAYVAGRVAFALEDSLVEHPDFRNVYEETKYAAEKIVRNSGLPFIVLRPSIIMGDSRDGRAESTKMAYGILRTFDQLSDLARKRNIPKETKYFIKGMYDSRKNIITIDNVVEFMLRARERGDIGKGYHLCNPQPTTTGLIFDYMQEALDMDRIRMSPQELQSDDTLQKLVRRGIQDYLEYFEVHDPLFDMTNAYELMKPEEIVPCDKNMQLFLNKVYIDTNIRKKKQSKQIEKNLSRLPEIKKSGKHILAYASLSNEFSTFRTPLAQGYVPYLMADKSAVMVGDPIGDVQDYETLITSYIAMCKKNGFDPSAIQISKPVADLFEHNGFTVNNLGIETHLQLEAFNLEKKEQDQQMTMDLQLQGKAYEKVRRWRNKARSDGITVFEQSNINGLESQIQHISDAWLKTKLNSDKELGVLLRKLDLHTEPYVRRFFAAKDQTLLGYVFFDPQFDNNEVIGYYANIERYMTTMDGQHLSAVKPYILLEAIKQFKKENEQGAHIQQVSLGLSPMYSLDAQAMSSQDMLFKKFFQELFDESSLYACKGIAEHKSKFPDPTRKEEPTYLAVESGLSTQTLLDIFEEVGIIAK